MVLDDVREVGEQPERHDGDPEECGETGRDG
jgi:hypothetical protein